ncbi:type II toxin-antitoxin system RelB/ParD family antitoxin [Streptococcus suis]|uniref:type II toxin-antitoxin system RelB/ParD family antitoxin n=1 Tax=Streptococcus suis TaxID=1307 RepID=UPI0014784702
MVLTVEKKLVNFQSDKLLVEEAKEILASQNMTMTQALNLFLKNLVVTKKVELKSEDELEKEQLFKQLQAEIQKSMDDIKAGNYLTPEEVAAELGISL